MIVIYFMLGALARVWYGADDLPKFWQNRGVQTAFMLGLFLSIYINLPFNWINAGFAVVISCWLQFQFWSRGHGCCIDMGRDASPSAETIKRYNERWYHKPVDWLFDKFFKVPDKKYGFLYDFFYTELRYACPMVPMMLIDWRYLLVGMSIAPVYSFAQTLQQYEPWVFAANKWYWRRGWSLAEILSGGIVYAACAGLGL